MGCTSSVEQNCFYDNYTLSGQLGAGTFGSVYSARRKGHAQDDRAVKVCSLSADAKTKQTSLIALRQEAKILQKVRGQAGCVQLIEIFMDQQKYYYVMEKCGQSLMTYFAKVGEFSPLDLAQTFRQMLQPVAFLHSRNIVHRDIKPENYLMAAGSVARNERSPMTLKLCDFGMATQAPKNFMLPGRYGTAPYMSPEMAGSMGHSLSTDVWSVGASAYLLLFGEFVYMPKKICSSAMRAAIVFDHPQPRFARRSGQTPESVASNFVSTLLDRNNFTRSCASQALKHPFLSDFRSAEDTKTNALCQAATADLERSSTPTKGLVPGCVQGSPISRGGPTLLRHSKAYLADKVAASAWQGLSCEATALPEVTEKASA
eukprot:gb/GFBE01070078.1/.p1 GENE.gb/GFBE01070078.1/~~gb/GFBE01070078.1/.p1  ORF type:complete len:373 (+),score=75.70 gb/GFBE01070078.1/:1-1119(+)